MTQVTIIPSENNAVISKLEATKHIQNRMAQTVEFQHGILECLPELIQPGWHMQ